eukprot:3139383-Pyramimonas_sp.AAC.2
MANLEGEERESRGGSGESLESRRKRAVPGAGPPGRSGAAFVRRKDHTALTNSTRRIARSKACVPREDAYIIRYYILS